MARPFDSATVADPSVATLFALLDRWRHLPAYQLERRADVFFALYLREVVATHLGVQLHEVIIPELPLRRGMLWPDDTKSPNKSVKVDYGLSTANSDTFYLLELKTAQTSRRSKQDKYLERAEELGLRAIVDGILDVAVASGSKYLQKYLHLLSDLAALGLVEVPPGLCEQAFPNVQRGAVRGLRNVRNIVGTPEPPVHVLYVQPDADGNPNAIGFEEFASIVERHGDDISREFANALRRWQTTAGNVRPGSL